MSETKIQEVSYRSRIPGAIGVDEHVIPASKELLIECEKPLDREFHCEKLMVWESLTGGTTVMRVLLGGRPILLCEESDPVKTVFFNYKALGNGGGGPVHKDEKISLLIRNDTAQDLKVGACYFGHEIAPIAPA